MRNLILIEKLISKYKGFCFQLSVSKPYLGSLLYADVKLLDEENYFRFAFQFLGNLISIHIEWTKCRDHAGPLFDLDIFGLSLSLNMYDTRHWDYENNCWHEYPEAN